MAKSKPKIQKRLAKLVLAALLCTGGVQTFFSPSVAEAYSNEVVYGTVTKDGVTRKVTNVNSDYHGYYLSGDAAHAYEISGGDPWSILGKQATITGYDVTLTQSGDEEDNLRTRYFVGGYGEFPATEVSGNTVTVNGEKNNWNVVAGGYLGGYYYAGDVLDTVTVKDNEVIVKSGTVNKVYGGWNNGIWIEDYEKYIPGTTTGNRVTISGGQVNGAYGGFAEVSADQDATVSNNTVTIDGGTVVEASGGSFDVIAILKPGQEEADFGTIKAECNTVNVNGGTVGAVYGGGGGIYNISMVGSANKNTVNVNGGTIGSSYTMPAYGEDGRPVFDSEGKMVMKTVLSAGMVYGGMSLAEASGNTINIAKDAKVDGALVVGGGLYPEAMYYYAYATMLAPDNEEMAESVALLKQAKADNNTVNILGPANVGGLFGGFLMTDSGIGGGSGNTLNLAAKNVSAYTVGGFQNMNFYLPKDIANGDTMLTIKTPGSLSELEKMMGSSELAAMAGMSVLFNKYGTELVGAMMSGSASGGQIAIDIDKDGNFVDGDGNILAKPKPTDLKGVTFGVAALQGVNLKKGDTVNLIVDKNGLTTDSKLKPADSATLAKAKFLAPHNLATDSQYELSIKKKDETTIITTVDDIKEVTPTPTPTPKPDSSDRLKSPVETRIAAVSLVNAGADLLAGQGFRNAVDAASDKKADGGFNSFVAVSGSDLREDSGSHVDVKGINMNLGFARELTNSKGKLVFGPVVEYGRGSYDSYQDSGIHGDGNTHYWGIGVLAKQVNNSGLYYEGSLRAGKTSSDYDADLSPVTHASYDSDATYWAAHLGIGKLQDIGKDNTLDYYGKYFYSHTGGDSVTIHATAGDETMDFSSVNSHRLRVGARVTHKLNENNKIYGGLGYQYEFKGNARATYNGGSTPSPTVKGSSGLLELGWQVKPGKGPMSIDLGVTGWVGKQRGVTANVQANWTF